MRHSLGILALVAGLLVPLPASAFVPAGARVTVHIKRVGHRQMSLSGRTPAYSDVSVTLVNARGGFLVKIGFGTSSRGRYRACVVAPRQAFRAIVSVQVRGGVLRKRSRLIPPRRPTDLPGCLPAGA